MRYFKYILFIPMFFLVTSCITPEAPQPVPKREVREPKPDVYYERKIRDDEDRDKVLTRARSRRTGRTCGDDDDCEEICDDIYSRKGEKDDCEDLSVEQVEEFERIHEMLEDPRLSDLEDIDLDDFDAYINIDIRPLDRLVGRYSEREAEDMLAWIANDQEVATVFEKEDRDDDIMKTLLAELDTDTFRALAANIDGGDSFMDLSVISDNEVALEWVHDILDDEECDTDDINGIDSPECLEKYCELAGDIDDDNADQLIGFEYFEKYIENIIEDGVNGCSDVSADTPSGCHWNSEEDHDDEIRDIDDLDEWWVDLCDGDNTFPEEDGR